MNKLKVSALGAAAAALLASTTGFCTLRRDLPVDPPPPPVFEQPTRLLPEAVIPYPLEEIE